MNNDVSKVKSREFKLVPMGSLEDFAAANKEDPAAHPEGEKEMFPIGKVNNICTVCSASITKRSITNATRMSSGRTRLM